MSFAGLALLMAQEAGQPGTKLESITAKDLSGNSATVQTAGKVTAVLFISVECPVSNAYNERMESLYKDYASKGVQFVFLNANQTESAAQIDRHAHDKGFTFKVWRDENNVMADRLGAQFTPETYVIDRNGVIVYHGRIDDQREESKVTVKNLRAALDATLESKAVTVNQAKAFGCTIKRGKKTT